MARELLELVGTAESDAATRAIVITGGVEGKFVRITASTSWPRWRLIPKTVRAYGPTSPPAFHRLLSRLMLLPKAVIAAINGECMGGGYELALACDLRLAADGPYQIGLPEATLGILPGGGGTQRLPRLIGRGKALEVMLFGNVYGPREAERMWMVNRVLAPETLMAFAMTWAQTLATRSPRSIAAIKCAGHLGVDRDLEAGPYIERAEMAEVMCSEDARVTMNAYNQAVAKDPMEARSNFLNGIGVPETKGG